MIYLKPAPGIQENLCSTARRAIVCTRGQGVNALAVVRSLGRAGITVHVISAEGPNNLALSSRYCVEKHLLNEGSPEALELVIKKIARDNKCEPIVYFDNDRMLASLASLQREFVEPFISTSPFSIVRRFLDKRNQNQAAATAGLNVPESWFPATWGDLEQLPSGTNRKLIAKARYVGSASPFPFKVISANDGPQLVSLLKTFSIRPSDILVQDFIDGADKNVFIAMCFVGSNSETSVIVTGRKLIQSGKGSGGVMALGRAEPNKYLEDLTRLLITHLGYQGLIGVEFKYCERSNRYYFIEVSARPERFNGLAAAAGIDLTLIAYRDANRDDISQLVNIAQKDSIWIDVHGCWSAFRQNLNFGVLKQVMGTLLLRHRCAVFALDDWAPTMAAWRATARDIGRRIVRKFRKIFGAT